MVHELNFKNCKGMLHMVYNALVGMRVQVSV